jgi:hypothetical protein
MDNSQVFSCENFLRTVYLTGSLKTADYSVSIKCSYKLVGLWILLVVNGPFVPFAHLFQQVSHTLYTYLPVLVWLFPYLRYL